MGQFVLLQRIFAKGQPRRRCWSWIGFGIQCWAKIGFMDNLGFVFKGVCSGGEGIPGLLLRFQRTTLFQLELEFS